MSRARTGMTSNFRRVALLVLAVALLPAAAGARVLPGLEGSINFTSLHYDHLPEWWSPHGRYALGAGFTAELPVSDRWSVLSGARYVKFGNTVAFELGENPVRLVGQFRTVQGYFAIPLLVQFRPAGRLLLAVGPEGGLLATAKIDVDETLYLYDEADNVTNRADVRDHLKGTNLWIHASAGYEFDLEDQVLVVRARYLHGLADVADADWFGAQWRTRGVEVSAGLWW